ncbi:MULTISPECIES: hypothetical protein [Bacillus]|uniref:Uncharacterized protein n=1 Tax=Bacillus cereus TaxID=1396 RepID=A0A164KMS4_BACCE|nr:MULTISPECIES: hypothetical protein [Bacillus]KZD51036.1 hypothetical protein B4088_6171 [Bacillus cereus]TSI09255.1 hypothetical protein FOT98_24490 [Bacillus sp. HY001]
MLKYKHDEEQRQYLQGKIDKLRRENELGSTLESQFMANEWTIKQYEMMMNEKKASDDYVSVELTDEERQRHDKREKAAEELHRIQCIKSYIYHLKQEMERQEYMLNKAEADMHENGLGHFLR